MVICKRSSDVENACADYPNEFVLCLEEDAIYSPGRVRRLPAGPRRRQAALADEASVIYEPQA